MARWPSRGDHGER